MIPTIHSRIPSRGLPNLDKAILPSHPTPRGHPAPPIASTLILFHHPSALVHLLNISPLPTGTHTPYTPQDIRSERGACWRWPSPFMMTLALSRNTCGVCLIYISPLVVRSSSLCPVSGDLDVMPGSLAEFALEHEFDDHHYLKNAWIRDIIASIVRVSLL